MVVTESGGNGHLIRSKAFSLIIMTEVEKFNLSFQLPSGK